MSCFFLKCDKFLYNVLILLLNWFFLIFVIFLEIVVLKIRGWLLRLNVNELCIIIGGELMIDLYICLVVDVFLDFYGFIK